MPTPPQPARFLFVTCQVGAERAVKGEVAQRWPEFHFAYSRPGFLTFKLPEQQYLTPDFNLASVFARAYGFSLGKVSPNVSAAGRIGFQPVVSEFQPAAVEIWNLLGDRPIRQIHVWERDRAEPGDHGFEPSITPAAITAHEALRAACPRPERLAPGNHLQQAVPGDWIADCVLVEPERVVGRFPSGPVGPFPLARRDPRPRLARGRREPCLAENGRGPALVPIAGRAGARFAEIGSRPGGASQSLLGRGFEVIGIDPAVMAPAVLANPKFRHIRRRAVEVPRRAFRKVRWLTADMNVAPNFTLDAIEAIVTHAEVNIRGMLLTLKLPSGTWRLKCLPILPGFAVGASTWCGPASWPTIAGKSAWRPCRSRSDASR